MARVAAGLLRRTVRRCLGSPRWARREVDVDHDPHPIVDPHEAHRDRRLEAEIAERHFEGRAEVRALGGLLGPAGELRRDSSLDAANRESEGERAGRRASQGVGRDAVEGGDDARMMGGVEHLAHLLVARTDARVQLGDRNLGTRAVSAVASGRLDHEQGARRLAFEVVQGRRGVEANRAAAVDFQRLRVQPAGPGEHEQARGERAD